MGGCRLRQLAEQPAHVWTGGLADELCAVAARASPSATGTDLAGLVAPEMARAAEAARTDAAHDCAALVLDQVDVPRQEAVAACDAHLDPDVSGAVLVQRALHSLAGDSEDDVQPPVVGRSLLTWSARCRAGRAVRAVGRCRWRPRWRT